MVGIVFNQLISPRTSPRAWQKAAGGHSYVPHTSCARRFFAGGSV